MTEDFAMSWYNKQENKDTGRSGVISLIDDEYLSCNFYEHGKMIGVIEYYDKSFPYVKDAVDNWCNGVITKETIKRYTKQGDLFS